MLASNFIKLKREKIDKRTEIYIFSYLGLSISKLF